MTEPPVVLPPAAGPVRLGDRIQTLDVVRGFALLGILTMNILNFGLPAMARWNPTAGGGFDGINYAAWWVCYLLFDEKMYTLFSMLFGAGLLLMTDRAEAKTGRSAIVFYRRAGVLLVIGLLHAHLLWTGDVLYTYALTGMVVYLFRKLSPRLLLTLGGLGMLLASGLGLLLGLLLIALKNGQDGPTFDPTPEELADEIRFYGSESYWALTLHRIPDTLALQTVGFVLLLFPCTLARMLIGLALMKLGVFSGERSTRFYSILLAVGYGLGFPLAAFGGSLEARHNFDFGHYMLGGREPNEYASVLVALGHAALLILVYKSGIAGFLTRRLAAVGRMALTNYLSQTLICTTFFYGYGFGYFNQLDRIQLLGVVACVWLLQLILSPIWLSQFRFGPAEWLWRTLTYGRWA